MAVVGAGYTGLSAALTLARNGASVVVLERHRAGWGASGRNGGFVLPGYKPDPDELVRRCGVERTRALLAATHEAIEGLETLIARESIDCGYARRGWISLAAKPGHIRGLERTSRELRRLLGHETTLLGAAELREEIGTQRYHGGLLEPLAGSLHPGRYCAGLAGAAVRAGALLVEGVEVSGVARAGEGATIATSAGPLRAAEVLLATNGYTGPAFPGVRRRVVPVGSYVVATEPLDGLAAEVLPRGRVVSDTWNLLHYFRLSDDGRLVFGGRASFTPTSVGRSARILAADLRAVFPRLAAVPLAYAWSGSLGVARDRMPHAGRLNGVHYALAYAGHGVALATWLGARMGDALAGRG
ncbi:MAG TPA: FAD-binding oxidoreductase, partial [Gemmatimonadales bacterium]|nr:FAD-binding oxidoreductase [Gemmatimonadales bacterium]